jgi:hypothetical protein
MRLAGVKVLLRNHDNLSAGIQSAIDTSQRI